ncbi:MAG: GntR family transcriptional regulator [Lawsonibacter sp.]|nr:GntR family transcriptional regulator [Lawsonibacter sp.]
MIITARQPRETGRDYALRMLKQNIIWLELEPGSMVSESDLAQEMGLSRTPVREALIELSKSKIVEIYPQKGSYISLIDYALVEEARFTRLVLEKAVVELACEMATGEDINQLRHCVRLQEFYLENPDGKAGETSLMKLDNEFHQMLFSICRKCQTYAMMVSFTIHFDRVRRMSLASIKDNKTVADHRAITEAIAGRSPGLAGRVMEKHLSRYQVDKETIQKDYPQYFI